MAFTELLEKAVGTALAKLDDNKVAQWSTAVKELVEMEKQLPGHEGFKALRQQAEEQFRTVEKKTKVSAWKVAAQEFLDVPVSDEKAAPESVS